MEHIITILTNFIVQVISSTSYVGVGLLMAIESAAIPLPSEIIMPFAGFVVAEGHMTLWGIILAGGVGSAVGSAITYFIGLYGGRPLVERWGKYVLISKHDLDAADRFFAKYGPLSTFVGRLLPVVRTFISIPAGIAKVNFPKFLFYSFVGSLIWSALLGYVGFVLGPRWVELRQRFHWVDYVIIILIILGAVWWVLRHMKHRRLDR